MTQHWRIITGDSRESLAAMPDASVHCCVTSPPYWGLRDYGVDGQMGLEKSPAEFVAGMVGVFREVRRVLRGDGTCWVNIGDCYASTPPGCGADGVSRSSTLHGVVTESYRETLRQSVGKKRNTIVGGLKPKDLCGIPWRLALALQDDGWYLRQDIIWSKPNPMPESVTDRCTKAHEYVFLLTKSARYFYDAKAIAEDSIDPESLNGRRASGYSSGFLKTGGDLARSRTGFGKIEPGKVYETRNARSVWTIATQPGAAHRLATTLDKRRQQPSSVPHYAMFPEELPRRCIKAGCPVGGVVLDPFSGMATTGKVALELGRSYVGIELNPKYAEDSRNRLREVSPLLALEAV